VLPLRDDDNDDDAPPLDCSARRHRNVPISCFNLAMSRRCSSNTLRGPSSSFSSSSSDTRMRGFSTWPSELVVPKAPLRSNPLALDVATSCSWVRRRRSARRLASRPASLSCRSCSSTSFSRRHSRAFSTSTSAFGTASAADAPAVLAACELKAEQAHLPPQHRALDRGHGVGSG